MISRNIDQLLSSTMYFCLVLTSTLCSNLREFKLHFGVCLHSNNGGVVKRKSAAGDGGEDGFANSDGLGFEIFKYV